VAREGRAKQDWTRRGVKAVLERAAPRRAKRNADMAFWMSVSVTEVFRCVVAASVDSSARVGLRRYTFCPSNSDERR
jgi:hypothetical protein